MEVLKVNIASRRGPLFFLSGSCRSISFVTITLIGLKFRHEEWDTRRLRETDSCSLLLIVPRLTMEVRPIVTNLLRA
jgi:hypothetical protein